VLEMPKDFAEHADETIKQLKARYGAGYILQQRWRDELGLPPKTMKKRVQQIDRFSGEVIHVFDGLDEAGDALFTCSTGIGVAARNYPNRTAAGYYWRYV